MLFFMTLLMGVTSGLSIVLLIPLLQLLSVGDGSNPGGVALFVQRAASGLGVELTIGSVLLIYTLLLSLGALLQYLRTLLETGYQQTFIYSLRRRLFRKIIMADWQLLTSRSRTGHLQVLTREVPGLANYYFFYLRLLTTLIMTLAYIVYALMISPLFTAIIIATGALLFVMLRRFLFRSFRLGEEYVSSYQRLLKYIDDFWQTVKIAKVHSSEEYYYRRFDEASSSLLDMEYRMQLNWSLPQLIQRLTGLLVLVGIVWFGFRAGNVPMASFIILILLFSRIFPQFLALNTDMNMIISNLPSVRMVLELDEALPDPVMRPPNESMPAGLRQGIELEGISFSYPGGEELFRDFTASIKSNTLTGVVGGSGRGKTTLIDMISGIQKPDRGRLLIDGRELDDRLLSQWKSGLGYLPQEPFFIDGTLRENLVWDTAGPPTDREIFEVLDKVNASHLVRRFRKGLDAYIVNYKLTFSGGECQRLALARVLLRRPSLLLLDEATSSLDGENETAIMEALSNIKESVTIVFVTHRESAARYFDAVIRL